MAALLVELGCGPNKRPGHIGIDRLALPGVDIVADLNHGLPWLDDNSVDEIYAKSLLEHIDQLELLMAEIWRVLKPGGRFRLFVPHFSNPAYYSDYTHSRFFGLYSFEYFTRRQEYFRRKVPAFYQSSSGFVTESIRLTFHSAFRPLRVAKRVLEKVVNSSPTIQEIFEENFCYLLPCYGILATIRPDK